MAIDSGDLIGSKGKVLFMPTGIYKQGSISIKTAASGASTFSVATTYTRLESADMHRHGWDSATLQPVANALEQTIMSLTSQSGVLTTVIAPMINGTNGTMTVKVTADGKLHTFTALLPNDDSTLYRLTLGATIGSAPATGLQEGAGAGQQKDAGFIDNNATATIPTPSQSLSLGDFGIPFNDSLVVTFQGSSAVTVGSASSKAVAIWNKVKPSGLAKAQGDIT